MEEEEKAVDTFSTSRIDIERITSSPLRDRVAAAVHAQCEFIQEIQRAKRVFDSPEAF